MSAVLSLTTPGSIRAARNTQHTNPGLLSAAVLYCQGYALTYRDGSDEIAAAASTIVAACLPPSFRLGYGMGYDQHPVSKDHTERLARAAAKVATRRAWDAWKQDRKDAASLDALTEADPGALAPLDPRLTSGRAEFLHRPPTYAPDATTGTTVGDRLDAAATLLPPAQMNTLREVRDAWTAVPATDRKPRGMAATLAHARGITDRDSGEYTAVRREVEALTAALAAVLPDARALLDNPHGRRSEHTDARTVPTRHRAMRTAPLAAPAHSELSGAVGSPRLVHVAPGTATPDQWGRTVPTYGGTFLTGPVLPPTGTHPGAVLVPAGVTGGAALTRRPARPFTPGPWTPDPRPARHTWTATVPATRPGRIDPETDPTTASHVVRRYALDALGYPATLGYGPEVATHNGAQILDPTTGQVVAPAVDYATALVDLRDPAYLEPRQAPATAPACTCGPTRTRNPEQPDPTAADAWTPDDRPASLHDDGCPVLVARTANRLAARKPRGKVAEPGRGGSRVGSTGPTTDGRSWPGLGMTR